MIYGICFAISIAVVANVESQYFLAVLVGAPVFFIVASLLGSLVERRKTLKGLYSMKTFTIIESDLGFTESAGLRIISFCYTTIFGFLQGMSCGMFVDTAFVGAALFRGKSVLTQSGTNVVLLLALILAIAVTIVLQVVNRLFFENVALSFRLRDEAIKYFISSTMIIQAGRHTHEGQCTE